MNLFRNILTLAVLLLPAIANAQLASLSSTADLITIVMAGAPATTQPNYSVTWSTAGGDMTNAAGPLTGVTAVTAVTGPESGVVRNVSDVVIYNADTAAVTVSVRKTVSGTSYVLLRQSLAPAQTLTWNQRTGVQLSSTTASGAGAATTLTGMSVTESGNGVVQKTTFTFTNWTPTVADATTGVGTKIYDFPEGRIFVLGSTGSCTFTTTSVLASTLNASASSRWGVGTVTQTNATLATTEQDLLPVTTFTSSATINVANTATTGALAAAAAFDGTATAKDAYFNISVPTATDIDADATVAINGSVTITWINLGDY